MIEFVSFLFFSFFFIFYLSPTSVDDLLEDVLQFEAGADQGEDGHDVLQGRPLRVPDDADRDDLGPVDERAADLDLGAAQRRTIADVAHAARPPQQLPEQAVPGRLKRKTKK